MSLRGFIPLRQALPYWPSDLLGQPELIDEIGIEDYDVQESDDLLAISGTLIWFQEISFGLPGLEGFAAALLSGDGFSTVPFEVDVLPDFSLRLPSLSLAFRPQSEFLQPVRGEGGRWVPIRDADGNPAPIELLLYGVGVEAGLDGDFELLMPSGAPQAGLGAVQLGETGFVLEIEGVALYFSRKQGPPPDGPPGWRGLTVESLKLHFPSDLDIPLESINFEGVRIGTGGFSGTIRGVGETTYDAASGRLSGSGAGSICGIPFALGELMLEFKQNTLVGSKIEGMMILPFFDQPVMSEVRLTNDGDFTVALSADQDLPEGVPAPTPTDDGLFAFTKDDLFKLKLASIAFEKEEEVFSIQLAGGITPRFGGFTWPEFEVKALTIDSRGRVSIDDGWIDLPQQKTTDFYGFALEVSKIGFGSEDDGARWIGFSGGLKLCEGLPMSAAVEGLRIYWKDGDFWLTFSGAEIAFEIPNSIAFSGRVAFIKDGAKHGFKGGGKLKVIPTGLEINAEVVIGKNERDPAYTFFYIFLETQLPAGIPLWSTGVSLYGIAGLFAYNMEPDKDPELAWYEGWYRGPPSIGVSSADKWGDQRGSFALGAGVTLGTTPDNGYSVNAKTLLVLVLPGPIVMLEGRGAFLKERTGTAPEEPGAGTEAAPAEEPEPPFYALAVLDGRAGQFLLNMEAEYPKPPGSLVSLLIQVNASAEAFFDFTNPNNWHLFVGQKAPPEKRVRASYLSLYEANAYLMLFPTRFEIGGQYGYNADWRVGPLGIVLRALVDGYAMVSWKPVHIRGGLGLIGELSLRAFGASVGLSLYARGQAAAPKPYWVFAEFDVKLNLPWPLPDPKAHIEIEWRETGEPPTPIPLSTVGVEHLKASEKWLLDRYPEYETAEEGLWDSDATEKQVTGAPELESSIVPLDAKPVLSFARPMVDAAKVGSHQPGVVAPEKVGDYAFQYRLVEVTLSRRSKTSAGGWEVVASRSVDDPDADKDKLWGAWLALDGEPPTTDSSQVSPMTKLMLRARSPFELARETIDDTYYDQFSEWNPTYGMSVVFPPKEECFGFDDLVEKKADGQEIREIRRGDVLIIGQDLHVYSPHDHHETSYLKIPYDPHGVTVFAFPEQIRQVELLVGKSRATCSYYDGARKVGERDVVNRTLDSLAIRFPDNLSEDFNLLIVHGDMELYRLCYITAKEADRFIEEDETARHASSAGDVYGYPPEAELLLPNSFYKLKVVTEVYRSKGGGSLNPMKSFTQYSYFQTADPPGIYEPSSAGEMTPTGEDEHYPARGPLRDLTPYVSKVMPAEGSLAVYRSYDVGAEFNEPYVETMYMLAGKPMVIYLYDNNGQGLLAPDGEVAAAANAWQENTEQERSRADLEWQATVRRAEQRRVAAVESLGGQAQAEETGHPAAFSTVPQILLDNAPKQAGVWGGGEDFVLKPNILYRAAIVAMVPRVVIPLTAEGEPIRMDGELLYAQVAADGSNFVAAVEESYGLPEPGMKVVSDGQSIAITDYRASDTAQPAVIDREFVKGVVREALGPGAPGPEPRAVYSWSFYTSRFTSFVHHIHSFVDAAWDLRKTLGAAAWTDPSGDVDKQAELAKLKDEIEKDPPDLEDIYQKAAGYFGLQDRPLPERLEINVLQDDHARYGFMIESPEPIAWEVTGKRRVKLDVAKAENMLECPKPAYGPVKLIDCRLQEEWVEVLVQTDLDLSGYKIEHIDPMADSSIPPDVYYTFAPDSKFRAGTAVRIHTHSQPDNYVPNVERKDLFLEAGPDVLNNAGETLRITDAESREIHRRRFAPMEFEKLRAVIAPDADGTRTFVFLRDNSGAWVSQVPGGAYRFVWTFRRNAGSKLPILCRRGSTADEEATIAFNVPAELP